MTSQREKYLSLPDGRVLAYDDAGNTDSKTIVLFFHGLFSVGDAIRPSPALLKHDVHYISPTLPGWGTSSPRLNPRTTPYYLALAQDITTLLERLHPGCSTAPGGEYRIYTSGGSYGSVAARMIFNASSEVFPPSRHIVACLLLSPISPFKYHRDYLKGLSLDNYIAVGPPSRIIPWRLVQRLASVFIARKLRRVEDAEVFIRSLIFDHLKEDEKILFEKWRKERGLEAGQFEREMAMGMVKSVERSWAGFLETADILHSDWGFKLEDVSRKPVIIVSSKDDSMAPGGWAKWLAEMYPNVQFKEVTGGHIGSLWSIDSTWEEIITL